MDESYAEVGTEVILGKHIHIPGGGSNWNEEKEAYVGMKTTIIRIKSRDYADCLCCAVACDKGIWSWRVKNMILASDVPLLTIDEKIRRRVLDG